MSTRVAKVAVVAPWASAAALIWLSVVWGRRYQRDAPEIFLGAAPLVGRDPQDGWEWRWGWGLAAAGLVAVAVAVAAVHGWWGLRLRWVVVAASLGAGAFATSLALVDGVDGVLHGADDPTEYLANVASAPPAAEFVRTFVDRIDQYTVHARGHPPGFVLVLKMLDAIGLDGPWPAALLSVAATIAVPSAVLVTVWATVDAGWARRVAPMLVVAPYVLWMVTSADAVFAAVGAWGVAASAVGLRLAGWRAVAAGTVSGLLLGGLLYLTYGGVTFLLAPVVIAVFGRRRQPGAGLVVISALGAAGAVVLGFTVAGFWWLSGAAATRAEYWEGTAQFRTWTYFGVANLAVALIALGPATLAGLQRLRDRRLWMLVAGGGFGLLAAHASQYTRGEVERIWLLFYPWIAVAAGALIAAPSRSRTAGWIGVQAAAAILLQAALVSKW